MTNILEYKGYHAKIELELEDNLLVGSVFGINDSLNFHGESVSEVIEMFHQSIDNYLTLCQEIGKDPEREYSGTFNVRIAPELHRRLASKAFRSGKSMNSTLEEAVAAYVAE